MSEPLEIDGSVLEGGGQILRISISLSAILCVPVRVTNIRTGRSKPGLAAQHLKGIELVAEMCQAKLKGASIGSTEIEFIPGRIKGGHYMAHIATAGSISLLLQIAIPCTLMADGPITLDMKGGTNADMAPQIDFIDLVFKHTLRKFQAGFDLQIRKRGYFPKGGGHVTVEVTPVRTLRAITLEDAGSVEAIHGLSFVAGTLPVKMAYEMSEGAKEQLEDVCSRIDIKCYKENPNMAPHNCSGIILWAETSTGCVLGSDGLGKRGVDSYQLGKTAGSRLRDALNSGACVDSNLQDQIIIYMALAEGKSVVKTGEITLHTRTAIYIAEKIAKTSFTVHKYGDYNIIECTGLSYVNKNLPA